MLFYELVGWRSTVAGFSLDTEINPFDSNLFFKQWSVGATYVVFSKCAKLVDRAANTESLLKLFNENKRYLKSRGDLVDIDSKELTAITKVLDESAALDFRHTVIAHNGPAKMISWEEADSCMRAICRAWALLTMWLESSALLPFEPYKSVYDGLDGFFAPKEIRAMKAAQDEYLEKVMIWCTCSFVTGQRIGSRAPFLSSITVSIESSAIQS